MSIYTIRFVSTRRMALRTDVAPDALPMARRLLCRWLLVPWEGEMCTTVSEARAKANKAKTQVRRAPRH